MFSTDRERVEAELLAVESTNPAAEVEVAPVGGSYVAIDPAGEVDLAL
jgi:hypothetical protein